MSVVQNPIVGRSSGKFSNAIFSKWKSKNTLRSKPLVVNQPNTNEQIVQRTKFSYAVLYARTILFYIRLSFASLSQSMSEFNMWIKKNIAYVDEATGQFHAANMADLTFSSGPLPGFTGLNTVQTVGHGLTVTWSPSYLPELRATSDIVQLICWNVATKAFTIIDLATLYTAGTITTPALGDAGNLIWSYIVTSNADKTVFSDSQFISEETLN